jgi:hypothetical protein
MAAYPAPNAAGGWWMRFAVDEEQRFAAFATGVTGTTVRTLDLEMGRTVWSSQFTSGDAADCSMSEHGASVGRFPASS